MVAGRVQDQGEDPSDRGVGAMARIKAHMTADEVLKRLGKPSGPSVVTGENDPVVTWPYPDRLVNFQYRDKAWRVVVGS